MNTFLKQNLKIETILHEDENKLLFDKTKNSWHFLNPSNKFQVQPYIMNKYSQMYYTFLKGGGGGG